jgi:hypothetical protein
MSDTMMDDRIDIDDMQDATEPDGYGDHLIQEWDTESRFDEDIEEQENSRKQQDAYEPEEHLTAVRRPKKLTKRMIRQLQHNLTGR